MRKLNRFNASKVTKFEDRQLAYLAILHLVQFTHMMEITHETIAIVPNVVYISFAKRRHRRHKSIRLQHEKERQNL